MNLSSRLERLKQQRQAKQAPANPVSMRAPIGVRTWLLLGLCLTFAGVATLAMFEFLVWTRVPPELVGVWEIEEGPQKGSTFEFSRDGMLAIHLRGKKKQVTHTAQVFVRDKALFMTTRDPLSQTETVNQSMIRELSADTLILELERGDVLKMVRIE